MDYKKIDNIEIDGIDTKDYPDFCDAYYCYGLTLDGRELTDQELETLSMENGELIHEEIFDKQLFL